MIKQGLKQNLAEKANGSTEMVKPEQKVADYLNTYKDEIARALPKHVTAERLTRIALTIIKQTPKLLECSISSLMGAVMQAATLGLEPGVLGQCYILPFFNKGRFEAQFIIGYQGLIELFYRSGMVETVYASEVCENDEFSYEFGTSEHMRHKPCMGERGKITHFYAYAKIKGLGYRFVVMTKDAVDIVRDKYAKSITSEFSPWRNCYIEMGCKTASRRLAKWLPKSVEIREAVVMDNTIKSDPLSEATQVVSIVNGETSTNDNGRNKTDQEQSQ